MKGTTHETTGSEVVRMTTGTPLYAPPTTGYPYLPTQKTAGHGHNRVAVIGATGVALLLAAMGGIAYYQYQQAEPAVTAVAPAVTVAVPQSVYDSQVPAAARLTPTVSVPRSVYDSQVPAAARLTPTVSVPRSVYDSQVPAAASIRVPLPAQAALAADVAAATRVTVPQSVYDAQVPAAARLTPAEIVPQSVYDQQVPHGAAPTVEVPQSVYDQQVPHVAAVPVPHGAAPTS